jgi:hypothetical protein
LLKGYWLRAVLVQDTANTVVAHESGAFLADLKGRAFLFWRLAHCLTVS